MAVAAEILKASIFGNNLAIFEWEEQKIEIPKEPWFYFRVYWLWKRQEGDFLRGESASSGQGFFLSLTG